MMNTQQIFQIATLGEQPEPIIYLLKAYPNTKKIFLICSDKSVDYSEPIEKTCDILDIDVDKRIIQPQKISNIIKEIIIIAKECGYSPPVFYGIRSKKPHKIIKEAKAKKRENANIFINITGGTKVMSSAALYSAYLIGAKAFYVWKNDDNGDMEIINLPTLNLSIENFLSPVRLKILGVLYEKQKVKSSEEIRKDTEIQKSTISHIIRELEKINLVKTTGGRSKYLQTEITEEGRLIYEIYGKR